MFVVVVVSVVVTTLPEFVRSGTIFTIVWGIVTVSRPQVLTSVWVSLIVRSTLHHMRIFRNWLYYMSSYHGSDDDNASLDEFPPIRER